MVRLREAYFLAIKEEKYVIKDNQLAAIFFGTGDENFSYLKEISGVEMSARGADIYIRGQEESVAQVLRLIEDLMDIVVSEGQLNINDISYMDKLLKKGDRPGYQDIVSGTLITNARGKAIKAKTVGQKRYV